MGRYVGNKASRIWWNVKNFVWSDESLFFVITVGILFEFFYSVITGKY